MKHSVLFLFFIINLPVLSQNYEAQYVNFGDVNRHKGVLTFNVNEWRYDMSIEATVVEVTSDDIDIENEEETSKTEYVESYFYTLTKNYYLWNPGYEMTIKGETEKSDWEILSDSVKKIGEFECTLAHCDLCGWKIDAWFTTEIPVQCGPWRLWGLPGLIVNANSEDGDIDIQLVSLKQVDNAPQEPAVKKIVSKEAYKEALEKEFDKEIRQLTNTISGNNRNMSINLNKKIKITDKCLE